MELTKTKFKQTEVGLIPEDWSLVQFSEIANKSVKNSITGGPFGSNLKTDDYTTDGIQIIQLQNIGDGRFIDESVVYTSERKADELKSCNIYPGEIILSKMGVPVARACIMPAKAKRFLMASDGIRLVVDEKYFSKMFAFHYINSKYFRNRAIDISTGSTRQRIGLPDLKSLNFIKPPLTEQKAIATALNDVDELIANLDKLIVKMKAIKQGAIQQLLTPPNKGGKRLPGFSGEWEEKTINELSKTFTKQTGFDYSNHIKPTLIDKKQRGHLPFIQNKDFQGHLVNFDTDYYIPQDIAVRFPMILLNERCLMISISGSIGKVGVFNNKQMAFIGGAVSVGKFHNPDYLDWVMNYLQSKAGQNMMLKDVKAGSHQNLILDDIRKMIIPMPKLDEQKAVNRILKDMEAEIIALEAKKEKYQDIKQGMMQELLTGKTRLV